MRLRRIKNRFVSEAVFIISLKLNSACKQCYAASRTGLDASTAARTLVGVNVSNEVINGDSLGLTNLHALHTADTADLADLVCKVSLVAVSASYNSNGLERLEGDKSLGTGLDAL